MQIFDGRYFIQFMLSAFYKMIESFENIWTIVTEPIYIDTEIAGIPIYWVADYTALELMFFGSLGLYITFVFIKFILDIIL